MGYYDDYSGGIQIFQLDQNDKRRYGVELIEAFPKTKAMLTATHPTDVQKLSVTFSYRYWKNLTDAS